MNTPKLTERGFIVFGEVTDDRGSVTTVQESSAADDEPYCWVLTRDRYGNEVVAQHTDRPASVSPHLTQAQACDLAALLLQFADINDAGLDTLREKLKGRG